MEVINPQNRSPVVYIALAFTAGFGRWVVEYGKPGESSIDIYQRAWNTLGNVGAESTWVDSARSSLQVLSVTNARRLYRQVIRAYEREHDINAEEGE